MDPDDSNLISTCVSSTDRLSNLPCNVIDQILALLPLKEVVRTSVLSKKWKNTWLTIPHLVFETLTNESIIYHVLRLHKEPIVKFSIQHTRIKSPTALNGWFKFLSKHRIEELTIKIFSYHHPVVPNQLFNFYNLKRLSLQEVEVRVPLSMYNGFSNLITIDFLNITIEVEELETLIRKCPKLESLRLLNCFKNRNSTLHISSPNLKYFVFQGSVDFIYIYSNPHLEDVSIDFWKPNLNTESDTVLDYAIKFFGQLSMIKMLQVNDDFLKVLARSVPSMLPKSLFHLEHIQLYYIGLDSVNNLKSALCLIRSSPNLQSILISLGVSGWHPDVRLNDRCNWDYRDEIAAIEYLKEEQKSAVPLSLSLKEVKIQFFSGWASEMEFVKLLFLGALELRKVELKGVHREDQYLMRKTLESFRRSSSQEIILRDDIF